MREREEERSRGEERRSTCLPHISDRFSRLLPVQGGGVSGVGVGRGGGSVHTTALSG